MEDWQTIIIRKHLDALINVTVCHTGLLSKLVASEIFGKEDVEHLTLPEQTASKRAYEFYNLIMTRKQGFKALIQGLRDTNQSGAVEILEVELMKQKLDTVYDSALITYEEDQENKLGSGCNGTIVFRGKFGGRDVAVKRVSIETDIANVVIAEIEKLKICDVHPNIVRYFGCKQELNYVLIILELCDMTLAKWVADRTRISIKPLEVLRQITVGLEWLHKKNILHRDLKPDNILLTAELQQVKISDFGLSRTVLEETTSVSSFSVGTAGWVAPEILAQLDSGDVNVKCKFTGRSDVFALGCVFYYVLTDGVHPFGSIIMRNANILNGTEIVDSQKLLHCCAQSIVFVNQMISTDPQSRPSCSDVLSLPMFWGESEVIAFLEDLKSQRNALFNQIIKYAFKDNCRFDHSVEINILKKVGCNVSEGSECWASFGYLQYQNSPMQRTLKRVLSSSSTYFHANLGGDTSPLKIPNEILNLSSELVKHSPTLSLYNNDVDKKSSHIAENLDNLESFSYHTMQPTLPQSDKVIEILNDFAKLDYKNKIGLLFKTVKKCRLATIIEVLESVAAFMKITEIWDKKKKSLLHIAVAHRQYKVAEYLINTQGFDNALSQPNIKKTLVHDCIVDIHTIIAGRFEQKCKILELIFKKQPLLIESRNKDKLTPLHLGAYREFENGMQHNFITMLLQNGANVNAKDKDGDTPLHLAVCQPISTNGIEIMKILITHNANTYAINLHGCTFLHEATAHATPQVFHNIVQYLASTGRSKALSSANFSKSTILHYAVSMWDMLEETLDIFKTHGVDFKATMDEGISIFLYAVAMGRSEKFLRALIRYGADWRIKNKYKQTALHYAASHVNLPAVKLLVSGLSDVDINEQDIDGDTPLHSAFFMNDNKVTSHQIVKELLMKGANVNLLNNKGLPAIKCGMEAVENGKAEQRTVDLLKNYVRRSKNPITGFINKII